MSHRRTDLTESTCWHQGPAVGWKKERSNPCCDGNRFDSHHQKLQKKFFV